MATVRIFKQNMRLPYALLAVAEGAVFFVSFYAGLLIRFEEVPLRSEWMIQQYLFAIALLLAMSAMGLYHSRSRETLSSILIRSLVAMFVGGVLLTIIFYALPGIHVGRGVLGLAVLVSFILVALIRFIFFKTVDQDLLKRKVLVLGAGKRARHIHNKIRRKTDRRGFEIVAYLSVNGEVVEIDDQYVITLEGSLSEYVKKNEIDEIVVAIDDRRKSFPLDELLECKLSGIEVVDILGFFEREVGKIEVDLLHHSWMIYSVGFDRNFQREILERSFDIFVSLILLVLSAPIMLLTIIAIYIEDGLKASLIYKQDRVGIDGKIFPVFKFRSMIENAEVLGQAQWAGEDDPRITKVGRIIRKFRIDELPQIFNVLKGDMSFVGPRPERPQFVETLGNKIPYYHERHRVKPGITGWAQLCYPYGASEEDSLQKLQYDLYYVKNHNLLLDLIILIQTVEVVIFGKGAR